jgi:hypothetical protein
MRYHDSREDRASALDTATAMDRAKAQREAEKRFRRTLTGDSSAAETLLNEQFRDSDMAYTGITDLNVGLDVRVDGRNAQAVVTGGAAGATVRIDFEDRKVPKSRDMRGPSFKLVKPATITFVDRSRVTGQLDVVDQLSLALLIALLQAAGMEQSS